MDYLPLFKEDKPHFHTSGGQLAVGFKIYTYAAGTDIPLRMYSDPDGSTEYQNPIVLNSRGEPDGQGIYAFAGRRYKILLKDADDGLVWSMDDVSPMGVGDITVEDPSTVYVNKQSPDFNFSNISGLISLGKRVVVTWSGINGSSYYDVSVKSSSSIKLVCVKDGEYRVLTLNSDDTSSAETFGISDNLAIFKAPLEGGSFSYPPISSVIGSYSEGKFVIIERVNGSSGTSSYMILTGCNASAGRVQFNGIGIKKDLYGIILDGVDVWQDMEMFDDNLNSYSINAVQNRVLNERIISIESRISELENG